MDISITMHGTHGQLDVSRDRGHDTDVLVLIGLSRKPVTGEPELDENGNQYQDGELTLFLDEPFRLALLDALRTPSLSAEDDG